MLPSINTLSRTELEQLTHSLMWDQHTGYMLGSAAAVLLRRITPGRRLVFVDFCNVHACNHFYGGLAPTNERWVASFQSRDDDTIIKWGGDEIAILLPDVDVDGYITRLTGAMRTNNVYAVIGIVTTSDDLMETIVRADSIVTKKKVELEESGQKPHRDEPYVCLDSFVVRED